MPEDYFKTLHYELKCQAQSLYDTIQRKRAQARELTFEADALAGHYEGLLALINKHAPKEAG